MGDAKVHCMYLFVYIYTVFSYYTTNSANTATYCGPKCGLIDL